MGIADIVHNLSEIGHQLSLLLGREHHSNKLQDRFNTIIEKTSLINTWFTASNIQMALKTIIESLDKKQLEYLVDMYEPNHHSPKNVSVILAGYKPVYGFPEMLCVLLSGHTFIGKQTEGDNELLEFIAFMMKEHIPDFNHRILFQKSQIKEFDAILANDYKIKPTYFFKYFNKYPRLLFPRKFTLAVIKGDEPEDLFQLLGKDIFTYFGRTNYNVTQLLVPLNYKFDSMLKQLDDYKHTIDNARYANQYEYNKSVYLLNNIPHLDTGYLMVRENDEHHTPVGCLHYSIYHDDDEMHRYIRGWQKNLETIISVKNISNHTTDYGKAATKLIKDRSRVPQMLEFLKTL
jgi:hypothetical protein